ncbi:MAG: hypothetical protein KAS98_00485 [Deltaproteobacteria bacterium]|nr:hypothetical protein [Deltaproteobacteria bacterium]
MSHPFITIPSFIHIYQGVETDYLNSVEIADYLKAIIKQAVVDIRPDIFCFYSASCDNKEKGAILDTTAFEMAKIKIRDINKKDCLPEPMQAEIDYEKRNLLKSTAKTFGIIYEGFSLQQLYLNLIDEGEKDIKHLHLVFTNQLFATWDPSNIRHHARVSIYGFPSIISTSGIVVAPAKPRDFYLKRQLGQDPNLLKEEYKGSFIDYGDPRMTDVLKGYVAQALFYHLVGYPFCEDKNCRLFNAHRQSELLQAQLFSNYEFCPKHKAVLEQLKDN